jgi:hypothetical protein
MTYEISTYFQKVWGRPQNIGNHRGGSEILGVVVRTPVARSTWRPGFLHHCAWTLVCVTDGSRGHIAMWPLVLLRSECCYVKKHIIHVNICPDKHRFSRPCAVHKGDFVWIDCMVSLVFLCRIYHISVRRPPIRSEVSCGFPQFL